jgi:LemA protein
LWVMVVIYNGLVMLRNNIEKSWSNIDVLLKQRHDEITNLIVVVKGYMKHERDVLQGVTEARSLSMQAHTVQEKAHADKIVRKAIRNLFAVAENYPDLKANQNFLHLQRRITGLENEIADRRELFNDSVTTYNIRIQSIPDVFVARVLGFKAKVLFKAKEVERIRPLTGFT